MLERIIHVTFNYGYLGSVGQLERKRFVVVCPLTLEAVVPMDHCLLDGPCRVAFTCLVSFSLISWMFHDCCLKNAK